MLYSKPIETQVVTITPEIASEWLSRNTANRKLTKSIVKQYADEMKSGQWMLNGESIKISTDGSLIDGQHRLHAIVEAQTSIQSLVISGIGQDVMPTVDVGKKRNTSDLLSMRGVSHPVQVASSCAALVNIRDGVSLSRSRVTALMSQAYLDDNPRLIESVAFTMENKRSMRWRPQYAAAHYLFSLKQEKQANDFFSRLFSGENLSWEDPVYSLREKLIKEESERKKHSRDDVMYWFIRAWNAERAGTTISKLHGVGKSTGLPEIE